MQTLDFDVLISNFKSDFQKALKVPGEEDLNKFNDLISKQYCQFLLLFKSHYAKLNFEETEKEFFSLLLQKLECFWVDYVEILRCRRGELEFFDIENVETAFFINLMTSSIHEVVTTYPSYNGEKILDKNKFIELMTTQNSADHQVEKQKKKKFENVLEIVDTPPSSNESSLDESDDFVAKNQRKKDVADPR